jgi:hypothetical protein
MTNFVVGPSYQIEWPLRQLGLVSYFSKARKHQSTNSNFSRGHRCIYDAKISLKIKLIKYRIYLCMVVY